MKKITPKLRFNGFEQNWQSNSFGQIVSNKSKKYNPSLADEDFPCIELDCVSQESGQLLKTYSAKQQSSIKNVFFQGDVLFGKLRPYLKKYLHTTFDGVCSTEFWVLTGKQVTNKFLYQYIQTNTFVESAKKSSGSKMPRADWDIVSSEQFYFPSDKEQNKIADFLSSVDEKIALQSRKVELLQLYKKGMMQKLFSQEIRFKNDNGCQFPKWKKTTLSCEASITMGSSPRSSYYNTNQNGLPLIQGNADIKNRYSEPRVYTSQITKECDCNDILLSVRAPVGEIARSKHHACIGRGIAALKAIGSNDQEFLYQLLLSIENKWDRFSQGSTFESINTNDIKTLPIEVPSLLEQKKIANLLSFIDYKITLEKDKLDKLKQWKQGLLQQMFV